MPIYMDRHIVPGIEAKHAAKAHREDVLIQDEYGCRCMTYWVDEDRDSAFCLIDAPTKEAVIEMHNRAHGLIPHEIVKVNSNVVEAFLGRITDPEGYYDNDDPNLKIFNDPAFRIILVSQIKNIVLLQEGLGKEKAGKLISLFHEIFRENLQKFEGREVESIENGFITSFLSVTQAVGCAKAIQKELHVAGELIDLRQGVQAGMPVDNGKVVFGETIKMAQYLCSIAGGNQIMAASMIDEIYKNHTKESYNDGLFKSLQLEEETFLQTIMDLLYDNLKNPNWGIKDFCLEMAVSKSKLYRKCTQIIGKSPNELIREHRLLKSLDLLKTERNVTQTSFDVGFASPSYYTKCFQEQFGIAPLSYLKKLKG
ncbi:MAG: DUF4242 domain-containing protein [Allomuricauda sp.]